MQGLTFDFAEASRYVTAGAHRDAVGVCAREMGDPQLALLLSRLLDGASGPAGASGAHPGQLLRQVVTADMLPGEDKTTHTVQSCDHAPVACWMKLRCMSPLRHSKQSRQTSCEMLGLWR